jgi:plasmid stabilization system protein ParE
MAEKRCAVEVTANFEANLDSIETFLAQANALQAFETLLHDIAESVVPNLERFPEMGRPFLERPADSVEARERIERLESVFGRGGPREYLAGDFLVLYAFRDQTVYLLSIKHHRQLSFHFPAHWS